MKPKFTKKEILDFFYSLSLEEVIKIVKDYDKKHKSYLLSTVVLSTYPASRFPIDLDGLR